MSGPVADVEVTTLGEVVRRTGGTLQTGPFGSQLHASDYTRFGTPLVMPINLGDNEIRESGIARIGPKDTRRLRRHALREGDIVFSRRGDVGRRSIVRAEQAGWLCGTGCLAARFGSNLSTVNPAYVAHYLGSQPTQTWLQDNAVGGTMPNLNTSILAALPIRLPLRAAQDAIAASLDDAAAATLSIEVLIAKKESIKQGTMQQLLTGRTRLPAFAEPWSRRRLRDLLSYEQPWRYLVQTSQQLESGRVPVLTAGKTFVLGYSNETHGIYTAHPVIIFDDFTTASKYVDFDFKAKSSAMKILSARSGVGLRFAYERMQLIDFPLGDHKRYWISEYSKLEIMAPDQAEQRAIGAVIADFDNDLQALRSRLEKARQVKSGMMQQLLTGRTRLPVQETAA